MYLLGIALLTLYLIPIILGAIKRENMFNPIIFISFMNIIQTIPYLFMIINNEFNLNKLIISHWSYNGLNDSIIRFVIISSIAYIFNILGLKIEIFNKFSIKMKEDIKTLNRGFIILFLIGILSYLKIMSSNGGIINFLMNINSRASMLRGNGFYLNFVEGLTISCSILVYKLKYKNNNLNKLFSIIITSLVFIIWASFGGRTPSIEAVLLCLFVYNFAIKKINIFRIRILILTIIVSLFIVIIPVFRSNGSIKSVIDNPNLIINEVNNSSKKVFLEISNVNTDIFTLNYFSKEEKMHGKTFIDLMYAIIPSNLYSDKPPVDDGVYIWNILNYNNVEPGTPYKYMIKSSWPQKTMGNMYMNFGIIGVIIGMFILGIIQKIAFNIMKKSNYNLIGIIIYFTIIIGFNITNLYIFQTISSIITISILFKLFFNIKLIRIK